MAIDPDKRQRVIDAAAEVYSERSAINAGRRDIARAADLPLRTVSAVGRHRVDLLREVVAGGAAVPAGRASTSAGPGRRTRSSRPSRPCCGRPARCWATRGRVGSAGAPGHRRGALRRGHEADHHHPAEPALGRRGGGRPTDCAVPRPTMPSTTTSRRPAPDGGGARPGDARPAVGAVERRPVVDRTGGPAPRGAHARRRPRRRPTRPAGHVARAGGHRQLAVGHARLLLRALSLLRRPGGEPVHRHR